MDVLRFIGDLCLFYFIRSEFHREDSTINELVRQVVESYIHRNMSHNLWRDVFLYHHISRERSSIFKTNIISLFSNLYQQQFSDYVSVSLYVLDQIHFKLSENYLFSQILIRSVLICKDSHNSVSQYTLCRPSEMKHFRRVDKLK